MPDNFSSPGISGSFSLIIAHFRHFRYILAGMKTLIIHPKDPSTAFLKGIYQNIPDKTVISGGVNRIQLLEYITIHDRVICCGHGSPSGLFSCGHFYNCYPYVIDDSIVKYLKNKPNNLYIWCYASEFVKRNRLFGFCSEMMISENSEALYYNFPCTEDLERVLEESNYRFSAIIGKFINEPLNILFKNLMNEYGELAKTNSIAAFNFKRLFLMQNKPSGFSNKVCNTGRV